MGLFFMLDKLKKLLKKRYWGDEWGYKWGYKNRNKLTRIDPHVYKKTVKKVLKYVVTHPHMYKIKQVKMCVKRCEIA